MIVRAEPSPQPLSRGERGSEPTARSLPLSLGERGTEGVRENGDVDDQGSSNRIVITYSTLTGRPWNITGA
jgi:hypothetical protein